MSNAYNMSAYPNYQNNAFPQQQKQSNAPSTFGMMTLGALGGGTVGYLKNRYPVSSDGVVSDTFAKNVFEANIKKNAPEESKKFFKELNNILDKIDKVKTTEDYKKLLKDNKSVIEEQCKGISLETTLDTLNPDNLKNSKKSLKEILQKIKDFELTKTKNAIKLGWDSETKKFVKTEAFKDDKLFEIIKKTKSNHQWKKALKYGGITAGVMGALTLGYKMLMSGRT